MIPRCRVRTLVARTRIALEPFTPDHLYRQPLCSGPQRSRLRRHLRCVHACCIPVPAAWPPSCLPAAPQGHPGRSGLMDQFRLPDSEGMFPTKTLHAAE